MPNMEPIYMDQNGLNNLFAEIEDIKQRIEANNRGRKQAFDAGAGDGWDSPEFEEIQRQEQLLFAELKRRQAELARVIVVEKTDDPNLIDIDDIVVVDMMFGPTEREELEFKLVGGSGGGMKGESGYTEVSINSPLGKTVYHNTVGASGSYQVNNNTISVVIKEKKHSFQP